MVLVYPSVPVLLGFGFELLVMGIVVDTVNTIMPSLAYPSSKEKQKEIARDLMVNRSSPRFPNCAGDVFMECWSGWARSHAKRVVMKQGLELQSSSVVGSINRDYMLVLSHSDVSKLKRCCICTTSWKGSLERTDVLKSPSAAGGYRTCCLELTDNNSTILCT